MKMLNKMLGLAIGVSLSIVVLEISSNHLAIARPLCQVYRVVLPEGRILNIYDGDQIIYSLPYNSLVSVTRISSNGEWAKIYYVKEDGKVDSGWVGQRYLDCYQE
jgi:hypothetical protein